MSSMTRQVSAAATGVAARLRPRGGLEGHHAQDGRDRPPPFRQAIGCADVGDAGPFASE